MRINDYHVAITLLGHPGHGKVEVGGEESVQEQLKEFNAAKCKQLLL